MAAGRRREDVAVIEARGAPLVRVVGDPRARTREGVVSVVEETVQLGRRPRKGMRRVPDVAMDSGMVSKLHAEVAVLCRVRVGEGRGQPQDSQEEEDEEEDEYEHEQEHEHEHEVQGKRRGKKRARMGKAEVLALDEGTAENEEAAAAAVAVVAGVVTGQQGEVLRDSSERTPKLPRRRKSSSVEGKEGEEGTPGVANALVCLKDVSTNGLVIYHRVRPGEIVQLQPGDRLETARAYELSTGEELDHAVWTLQAPTQARAPGVAINDYHDCIATPLPMMTECRAHELGVGPAVRTLLKTQQWDKWLPAVAQAVTSSLIEATRDPRTRMQTATEHVNVLRRVFSGLDAPFPGLEVLSEAATALPDKNDQGSKVVQAVLLQAVEIDSISTVPFYHFVAARLVILEEDNDALWFDKRYIELCHALIRWHENNRIRIVHDPNPPEGWASLPLHKYAHDDEEYDAFRLCSYFNNPLMARALCERGDYTPSFHALMDAVEFKLPVLLREYMSAGHLSREHLAMTDDEDANLIMNACCHIALQGRQFAPGSVSATLRRLIDHVRTLGVSQEWWRTVLRQKSASRDSALSYAFGLESYQGEEELIPLIMEIYRSVWNADANDQRQVALWREVASSEALMNLRRSFNAHKRGGRSHNPVVERQLQMAFAEIVKANLIDHAAVIEQLRGLKSKEPWYGLDMLEDLSEMLPHSSEAYQILSADLSAFEQQRKT